MSMLTTAPAAQRLAESGPAWSLLRAQHAGPVVAILGADVRLEQERLDWGANVAALSTEVREGSKVP
ncbi:hypothetical protein [Georgenia sp. AZ-5]|uniref:hypothetical protein n=1 Tax=Georgenia sp. AZ-5 TaxID=3367526 RepID=UPI003754F387